jgi:hypothetical protein
VLEKALVCIVVVLPPLLGGPNSADGILLCIAESRDDVVEPDGNDRRRGPEVDSPLEKTDSGLVVGPGWNMAKGEASDNVDDRDDGVLETDCRDFIGVLARHSGSGTRDDGFPGSAGSLTAGTLRWLTLALVLTSRGDCSM